MDALIFIPTNSHMHSLFFTSVANTPLGHQATSYEWFFFQHLKIVFICLFIFGCTRSWFALVVADEGHSPVWCAGSHCGGLSCRAWALDTQASVPVALRLGCPEACGIFPDQGSNPCPLLWEADSPALGGWAHLFLKYNWPTTLFQFLLHNIVIPYF